MQDPNQDTEWNDVLRAKGVLPPRETVEVTEEDLVNIVENTIAEKSRGDSALQMTEFYVLLGHVAALYSTVA